MIKDNEALSKWYGKKANFLGDSITEGLYSDDSALGSAVAQKPYHQWIKELLGLSIARNYGVSGTHISGSYPIATGLNDRSKNFCARFDTMDSDADLIVVLGGTNDFGHPETSSFGTIDDKEDISFYGALHVLMNGLCNKYLGKKIVFITPLHRDDEEVANITTGKTLTDYANAIKEVGELYNVSIIDGYNLPGLNCNFPDIKEKYINDGLHPNELGHELLGKALAPLLNSI